MVVELWNCSAVMVVELWNCSPVTVVELWNCSLAALDVHVVVDE
jgi:hypothetical protein